MGLEPRTIYTFKTKTITFLIKDLLIFVVYVWVFCLYVSAPCACSANKGQQRASDIPELELPTVVSSFVGAGNGTPGPRKEQAALLSTKPSPHPPQYYFFWREQWYKQQFIPPLAATLKIFTPWLFSEEQFALLCSESPTLRKKQSLAANNSHWRVSYTIPAVGLCPSPASQFRGKIEHCGENSRESYKD